VPGGIVYRSADCDGLTGGENDAMPRIAQFYGIAIYMHYRDHAPPHFHAIYGEHEAVFEIATATLLDASSPRRARSFVIEWAEAHREELQQNWDLAKAGEPLNPIDPLE
jgi:hypothetical protein